jgi:hypothetical protein
MSSVQIPRGPEREYLAILGVAAIYGVELPIGASFIGVSRDLNLSMQSLKRRFPGAEIVFCRWVKDRSTAEALRREASTMLPSDASTVVIRFAIENAAEQLAIVLTGHDVVMQRVRTTVAEIEDAIEHASQNGELQWFHSAFREWRLQARSVGRVMTYSEARARLRRAVLCSKLHAVDIALAPTIFPTLPNVA